LLITGRPTFVISSYTARILETRVGLHIELRIQSPVLCQWTLNSAAC